jgi:hypothetical protein
MLSITELLFSPGGGDGYLLVSDRDRTKQKPGSQPLT